MPLAILKYRAPVKIGPIELDMPEGAQVVGLTEAHNEPCLIVAADPSAKMEKRNFLVTVVGAPIPAVEMEFAGAYMLGKGEVFILELIGKEVEV